MTQDCGQFLDETLGGRAADEPDWDAVALEAVQRARAAKRFIPVSGTRCTRCRIRVRRP